MRSRRNDAGGFPGRQIMREDGAACLQSTANRRFVSDIDLARKDHGWSGAVRRGITVDIESQQGVSCTRLRKDALARCERSPDWRVRIDRLSSRRAGATHLDTFPIPSAIPRGCA